MSNDLTDQTSGELIDDKIPEIPPKDSPLEAPEINRTSITANSSDALDALAGLKKPAAPAAPAAPKPDDNDPDALEKAADAAAEKAAKAREAREKANEAARKTKEEGAKQKQTAPAAEQQTPEQKAEAEKKAAEAAKQAAEPSDAMSKVQLPPYAKPATGTAFAEVKRIAREEIATLKQQLEEAKTKIPADGALPKEINEELKELRAFRQAHDLQGDATFKATYDKPVAENTESILSKLQDSGLTKEHIEKIKAIGLDKLDWEPILSQLQPGARRLIEAKLLENETLREKKAAALKKAETAPEEYSKARRDAEAKAASARAETARKTADTNMANVPWFKKQEVPVGASAEERQRIESDNKFYEEQKQRMETILGDQSPEMFGQLAASTLLAYKFKNDATFFEAKFKEAKAELDRIQKASTPTNRKNNASNSEIPNRSGSIFKSGADALDELARAKSR